jgi:hypothetical protein
VTGRFNFRPEKNHIIMKTYIVHAVLFAILFVGGRINAQEVRLQGNLMVLGYIENPFVGFGVGYENGLGKHFSVGLDVNVGWQEEANAIDFRPAVRYYFGQEHFGFFGGVSFKYISLNEKNEEQGQWEDNLFAPGLDLGVKARVGDFGTFGILLNPHKTVGGSTEADVAGMSANVFFGYRF